METSPSRYDIEIANCQSLVPVDEQRIRRAISTTLWGEHVPQASLSIAIVDDAEIHSLNREFLEHDYPTDVLSFRLNDDGHPLEGEIVLSAETAARGAPNYGWRMMDEVCLYLIHGTLHLLGYDDATPDDRQVMRRQEQHYLRQLGLEKIITGEDDAP